MPCLASPNFQFIPRCQNGYEQSHFAKKLAKGIRAIVVRRDAQSGAISVCRH